MRALATSPPDSHRDDPIPVETHLNNPAVFVGTFPRLDTLASEYLELAKTHQATMSQMRAHLFRLWHPWYDESLCLH